MSNKHRIIRQAIRLFGCDNARISRPLGKWFLVLMWKRHTRDAEGWYWLKNGQRYDFEYHEEHCVASGDSAKELRESMHKYYQLLNSGRCA